MNRAELEEKHMEKDKNKNSNETPKRQKCEVYSRVVGYLRPVSQWNDGKQAEFNERKCAKV